VHLLIPHKIALCCIWAVRFPFVYGTETYCRFNIAMGIGWDKQRPVDSGSFIGTKKTFLYCNNALFIPAGGPLPLEFPPEYVGPCACCVISLSKVTNLRNSSVSSATSSSSVQIVNIPP
jgi:hypothetical protein